MGPKKSKRHRSKLVRDLTFCCCPRSSVFAFQEEVVCLVSVVGLDFCRAMQCHAVRKAPDLESPVPSQLLDRVGFPPEGQIVVNLTSQSFLVLIQSRKEWDQKICHV